MTITGKICLKKISAQKIQLSFIVIMEDIWSTTTVSQMKAHLRSIFVTFWSKRRSKWISRVPKREVNICFYSGAFKEEFTYEWNSLMWKSTPYFWTSRGVMHIIRCCAITVRGILLYPLCKNKELFFAKKLDESLFIMNWKCIVPRILKLRRYHNGVTLLKVRNEFTCKE